MWRPVSQISSPSSRSLPIRPSLVSAVWELMDSPSSSGPLFVVSHDSLEEIAEALVAARVILSSDLEQELLERVEAAQLVAAMV